MKIKEIQLLLIKTLELNKVYIQHNEKHVEIIAIGEIFTGLSQVQRQQKIYLPLMQYFKDQKIHSITIHAYSLKEWKKHKKH